MVLKDGLRLRFSVEDRLPLLTDFETFGSGYFLTFKRIPEVFECRLLGLLGIAIRDGLEDDIMFLLDLIFPVAFDTDRALSKKSLTSQTLGICSIHWPEDLLQRKN